MISEKGPLSSIDWMMIMWTFQFDLNEEIVKKAGKFVARSLLSFECQEASETVFF